MSAKRRKSIWWMVVLPDGDVVRRIFERKEETLEWLRIEPSGKAVRVRIKLDP